MKMKSMRSMKSMQSMTRTLLIRTFPVAWALVAVGLGSGARVAAQAQTAPAVAAPSPVPEAPRGIDVAADYVIGAEDVLGIQFWREPDMTADLVKVRPDGMITLPLLGDLQAAGLKPEALGRQIQAAAAKLLTDPRVTVAVREINSRKVFITGEVATPGQYPLTRPLTVMQLIAVAGGLNEYADAKNITIMRTEDGRQRSVKFNYRSVAQGKALTQNIQLQPGDTVVVP